MRILRSFAVAILLLCVAACGSRLSQENFDKIHEGMSQKEVREILGDPVDASPTVAGRQLFLRGQKFLYCIEEK